MAKVIIEIEDRDGKVCATVTPKMSELLMGAYNGHGLSSAEAYAVFVLNELRKESHKQSSTLIEIPKILRP